MFYDLALTYDPESRTCDLALGEDADLVIDETPVTPMLLSVGLDRRAAADDDLPDGRSRFLAPISYSERRGGPADALDPAGALIGSRLWLLSRAKQTDTTLALCKFYLEECLAWAKAETGEAAEIEAEWRGAGLLVWRASVADVSISLSRRTEG